MVYRRPPRSETEQASLYTLPNPSARTQDEIKTEDSIETGCIWFDAMMMPPVERALNNKTYTTAELAALKQPREAEE